MAWTNKRVERLRHLWASSLRASEIAAELDVTRCAVLGKLSRLGLLGKRSKPEYRRRHLESYTDELREQIAQQKRELWSDPEYKRKNLPKFQKARADWLRMKRAS